MNYRMIAFVLGRIFMAEAGLLLLPLGCGLIYGEDTLLAFLIPILLLAALGCLLGLRKPKDTVIYARDGLVVVALAWVLMSAFGALPFLLSGDIPDYTDAFFEMVSGFTTTGSSILTDVEAMSRSCLFWRSLSHWVGGMGVLVFVMAVVPMTDGRAMHLMRAEVPGPTVGKLSSKLQDTAKILYRIYLALTALEVILLLAGGMPLYDSLIHAFGTAGTGGFSCKALSVGAYNSAYIEMVVAVFMLLFGINFNLYYFILLRHFRQAFLSEELLTYLGVVAASTLAIAINLGQMCSSFAEALRLAFFQVTSIVTTTGYATTDFNLWPSFSRNLLVMLMFLGACAGSTAGGLKISRVIILIKSSAREVQRMLHPHAVTTIRFEGRPMDDRTVRGASVYLSLYLALFVGSIFLLSFDGFDLITNFTAVATCINNVGPGLDVIGPMGSFADFSPWSKWLLSFNMLAGRLELFPMLALFAPSTWRRRRRHGRVAMRF